MNPELELQRLAAIVEGSDDAIISKTLDGVVSSWNAAAARMFGYTAAEMLDQPINRIIPAALQAEEAQILAKLARGEHIKHFDTVRLAKDGSAVPVSLTISPLRDPSGKVVGVSKIARDISTRKEFEFALRDANETLIAANEAARLSQLEAEKANRAKTDFLAVMSHEIRTPLNSIHGFVDLLTTSTKLTSRQRRYADLVTSAAAALRTIVEDILDFAKVETGHIDLHAEAFSLGALINDTMAIIEPASAKKNLRLIAEIGQGAPDWILGDKDRLRQILLNLLNNAVKFTHEGSIKLVVGPRIDQSIDGKLFFSVTDTGIGVPEEHKDRLFREFSQADGSISRKYGGSGLGLAISKRLVELMGGEIGIISDVGRGSTVWFTARLAAISEPSHPPASEIDHPKDGRRDARILVVDDIDTNLEIVEAYLRDSGYHVDCVTSGFDALQLLANEHFDLILMDVQMPLMDGVTATQRIRALPGPVRDIPIIAMTGNVLPHQVKVFVEAGMNDHVGKPIERAKLRNNVRRWLPRPSRSRTQADSASHLFREAPFEEFILVVGIDKAKQMTEQFLTSLTDAFRSTFENSRREAHELLNVAGVLGLSGLVQACRKVTDFAPSRKDENGADAMRELLMAQSAARQTVMNRLLPRLRNARVPAMNGQA